MKISLQKKILFLGLPTLVVLLALLLLQGPIFKVSAQIVPVTVSLNHLAFGTVFPGEELEGDFIVTYADTGDGITYRIVQGPKPLPQGHPDYPGFYKDLCPYLEKVTNEGEGDVENDAFVGPNDLSDTWIIYFKVPAVFGHVAQDHTGGVIDGSGEYGCDISIDITEPFIIDTIVVPSDGSVVSSVVTLDNGKEYMLKAIGTYVYWPNCPEYTTCIADAKYSLRPSTSYGPGWVSGDDMPSPWTNYLEVLVDGAAMVWGVYDASHTYAINHTGDGTTVDFNIIDSGYGDNSGSITVEIYELP